jgi:hypothetical protein
MANTKIPTACNYVRERLAKLVEKVLVGDGPTGPKLHGNWRNDEREA